MLISPLSLLRPIMAINSAGQIYRKTLIDALAEHVSDTSRGTTLLQNNASVATIEHVLASFYGLGVDNALIEIDGPEAPIMGGSALKFVEAIKEAGIMELKEDRNYYVVKQKIAYSDEEHGVDLIVYPDDHLSINVLIDYNSRILGNQYAILDTIDDFEKNICSSRTFVFFHELEPLYKMGLIKGGDLDNAVVILEKEVSQKRLTVLPDCSTDRGSVNILREYLIIPNSGSRMSLPA
jgi:UDP-3-O-[3-hydroxymyristoyl] N-acetylglucosamine deacetylase/3-hydroxyacyl-[acyl-carrier-protein] dehydratase